LQAKVKNHFSKKLPPADGQERVKESKYMCADFSAENAQFAGASGARQQAKFRGA
jgi:hypothetical protein